MLLRYRATTTNSSSSSKLAGRDLAISASDGAARRSPRHVVEGNDVDEVIAKSRELIERELGAISEFKQVAGKA